MKSLLGCIIAMGFATDALFAQDRVDPVDEFVHLEPVLHAAMEKAAPSVVTIETFGGARKVISADEQPFDSQGPSGPPRPKPNLPSGDKPKLRLEEPGFHQTNGKTTGVVLTADGWILVSRFALNFNPSTILVTFGDQRTFHAERGGEDTSRGIALVKIDVQGLPVPEFVHPKDVKVGQWAFALGRTFGVEEPTVHIGIVSATRRQFGRALQIDAYTSPANYGGAVIDASGRVLGIAVPLSPSGRDAGVEWYDSGIGFATTIADIPEIVGKMKLGQAVHRGWLGVSMDPKHLGPGAKLMNVPKGGVAFLAGLRFGDIIEEIDGASVLNSFHLQMLVSSRMGGDSVGLKVKKSKGGELVSMTLILADTPFEERQQNKEAELPASFPLPEKK